MIYDDLNHVTCTGRILKTEVREFKRSKKWILVVRIAINKSSTFNGVITKYVTVVEGQGWYKVNPCKFADMLTKGTRVLLEGPLKELKYTTKDGNKHKTMIITIKNISIFNKSPNDGEKDETIKEKIEIEGTEDNEEFDIEDIFDDPLF